MNLKIFIIAATVMLALQANAQSVIYYKLEDAFKSDVVQAALDPDIKVFLENQTLPDLAAVEKLAEDES